MDQKNMDSRTFANLVFKIQIYCCSHQKKKKDAQ